MTVETPFIAYPSSFVENSFTKSIVKFLTAGTLVVTYGVSNIPINLNAHTFREQAGSFDGVIKYPNGPELEIMPTHKKEIMQQSSDDGIEYNGNNTISDIILWTDTSKEAISLNPNPPIYTFEKTVKSRLKAANEYQFAPIAFDDEDNEPWELELNDANIYQFSGTVKSKIRSIGELQFSPINEV